VEASENRKAWRSRLIKRRKAEIESERTGLKRLQKMKTIYVRERTDPRLKERTRRYVDKSDPILGDRGEIAADEGKGKNVTRET